MAFGGLDIEALRAELSAARQERVVLLQQAADLDTGQFGGGASSAPFDGFQGFAAAPTPKWGAPSAADTQPAGPRRLSWGTPRAPMAPAASAATSTPIADNGWGSDGGASRDGKDDYYVRASFALNDAPPPPLPPPASTSPYSSSYSGALTPPGSTAPPATAVNGHGRSGGDGGGGGGFLDLGSRGSSPMGVEGAVAASAMGQAAVMRQGSAPRDPPHVPFTAPGWGFQAPSSRAAGRSSGGGDSDEEAAAAERGGRTSASARSSHGGAPASPAAATAASGSGGGAGSGGSEVGGAASPSRAAPPPPAVPNPVVLAGGGGSGGGGLAVPAIKFSSAGLGGIAAAASRAAAAAASVATTGQPAVPWAAHHTSNAAGAGVDLEAHRRMVLKELLAAVLGEPANSAKLEHMRLDVESVAAIVRQRTTDAAAAATAEAEERAKSGLAERQAKALKAAEERGEKALVEVKRTLEEEKRRLQIKMDKFRGQLADLEKEKKSLSGKSGQQSRELRETKEALMLAKQLLSTAQNTADGKGKALAKALAEVERVRAEAAEQAEARAAEVAEARAEVAAVRQEAAQQLEAARQQAQAEAQTAAQSLVDAHVSALAEAQAEARQAQGGVEGLRAALEAEVEALAAEAGQLAGAVGSDLAEAGEDLAGVKADLAAMRSSFHEELQAMREATYAAIGGFHAACQTASRAHAERAAQLMGLDERLQRLGPGGVTALLAEAETLRVQLAEARAEAERAKAEAAGSAEAERRTAANAELTTRELQMMSAAQRDLSTELSASRSDLVAAMDECEKLREAAEKLRGQLRRAKEEVAEQHAVLQGSRRELEAARNAAQRYEAEAVAAGRRGVDQQQQWRSSSEDGVAAGRQEAVTAVVNLLSDMRERYFHTLPPSLGSYVAGRQVTAARTSPTRLPYGSDDAAGGGDGGNGEDCGALVSELEAAVGVRLHDLTVDRVSAALEGFLARQALLSGDASPLRARGPCSDAPSARTSPSRLRGGDQQHQGGGTGAIVASAAGGGWQRRLVSELVWLEGCLLVALLDLRLNGGRGGGGAVNGIGREQHQVLRNQVLQLVRNMLSDSSRPAMQRGRHPQPGGGSPGPGLLPPPPASFSSGGTSRRSLASTAAAAAPPPSARSGSSSDRSAGSGGYRAAPIMPNGLLAGAATPSQGGGGESVRFGSGQYGSGTQAGGGGSGGVAEPDMAATPRGAGQRRGPPIGGRSVVRRSTDTDAVVGLPPAASGMYGMDGGAAAAAATAAGGDCMLPPLPNPYSAGQGPGGLALQAPDMDELMDVLQALDDSAFRRSRCGPLQPKSHRQPAWTAWDSPAAGGDGGGGGVGVGVALGTRRGGGNTLGTPPKGPSKGPIGGGYGGGYDGGAAGSPATGGRAVGRAVSWSGPGAGGGTLPPGGVPGGAARGGGRVSSADAGEGAGGQRGSPYLNTASARGAR